MLLTKHRTVRPLNEDLSDLGIDSEKFTGQVDRMSQNLTEGSSPDGTWKGSPPLPTYGVGTSNLSGHVNEERSLMEDVGLPGEPLDEFEIGRSATTKKGQQRNKKAHIAGKKAYRKGKGAARAAGRISRRKNKVAIKRRAKRKNTRFSAKQQSALHRAGKAIKMSDELPDLDQLREEITGEGTGAITESLSVYGEAALNASLVSLYLSEIFEEVFEEEAGEAMSELSDYAGELSEELDQHDTLDDAMEAKLNSVLEQVLKGLRFHEAMDAPSLLEACEYHAHKLEESDDDGDDLDEMYADKMCKKCDMKYGKDGKCEKCGSSYKEDVDDLDDLDDLDGDDFGDLGNGDEELDEV